MEELVVARRVPWELLCEFGEDDTSRVEDGSVRIAIWGVVSRCSRETYLEHYFLRVTYRSLKPATGESIAKKEADLAFE